jgi:hypothetical protein
MGTIIPFLRDGLGLGDSVFEPHDIQAMSRALDGVCEVLKLRDSSAKEVIAGRIIDLARRGERSPTLLRDRVLTRRAWLNTRVLVTQARRKRPLRKASTCENQIP